MTKLAVARPLGHIDDASIPVADPNRLYNYGVWDVEYARPGLTDWEQLPSDDMRDVVSLLGAELESLRNGLEIGCGRGLRAQVMVRTLAELNRHNFSMHGIDQSEIAIAHARALTGALSVGEPLYPPFAAALTPFIGIEPIRGHSLITYERADLFIKLRIQEEYDLIIDWMCFHEIEPLRYLEYASLVAARCRRYFVINLFSAEGSSVDDLGLVAGVQKRQNSERDVRALFEPWFDLIGQHQSEENLDPSPAPSDGVIAAKRAYIFRRKA